MEHKASYSPPEHLHINESELFIIRSGRYTFKIGNEIHECQAGDIIIAPKNTPHTFRCDSNEGGSTYVITVPGGLELFFKVASQPAVTDIPALANQHGMRFVGPPLPEGNFWQKK